MTLLAPDDPALHQDATMLRLDPPAVALLRALAVGGAARHPVFGGPAGQAARRLLTDQGALDADGALTPPTTTLLEPLRRPRFRLLARVHGPTERRRAIWVGERAATVATPHPDGTLALRHEEPSRIGADLVSWLGVRPLPEREGRSAWSCRPLDLTMPGTHTAWVVERRVDDPASMRWVAAVDAGRDGWRTASGSAADRRSASTFRPVGVAAVYVALSHMV